MKRLFPTLLILAASALPAWRQSSAPGAHPPLPAELERVRAALEKYQDPIAAIHDGYFSTLVCVNFPHAGQPGHMPYRPGAMGVHFVNPSLISSTLDPMRPQVLLYEPEGGKLRLVGAEWFVPLATGVKQRPQIFGQPFWGPMEGHHPVMPTSLHHYDLHVWLFKENPYGVFAATNPAVKCDGYPYAMQLEAPPLVPEPKPPNP